MSRDQRLHELAEQVRPTFGKVLEMIGASALEDWQERFRLWDEEQAREFRRQLNQGSRESSDGDDGPMGLG